MALILLLWGCIGSDPTLSSPPSAIGEADPMCWVGWLKQNSPALLARVGGSEQALAGTHTHTQMVFNFHGGQGSSFRVCVQLSQEISMGGSGGYRLRGAPSRAGKLQAAGELRTHGKTDSKWLGCDEQSERALIALPWVL